jgi:DNA-binding MurR/RpiR family transcriptional regulator
VVIAISQSGRTQTLLDSMALAKQSGGIVIALAPSGTPVAEQASIAIEVNATEDTQIFTPLSSRIAHLVMIDVLAIGVAQKKGPKLEEHLTANAGGAIFATQLLRKTYLPFIGLLLFSWALPAIDIALLGARYGQ